MQKNNYTAGGGVMGTKKHSTIESKITIHFNNYEIRKTRIHFFGENNGTKNVFKIILGKVVWLLVEASNQSIVFFKNDSSWVSRKTLTITFPLSFFYQLYRKVVH